MSPYYTTIYCFKNYIVVSNAHRLYLVINANISMRFKEVGLEGRMCMPIFGLCLLLQETPHFSIPLAYVNLTAIDNAQTVGMLQIIIEIGKCFSGILSFESKF